MAEKPRPPPFGADRSRNRIPVPPDPLLDPRSSLHLNAYAYGFGNPLAMRRGSDDEHPGRILDPFDDQV